MAGDRRLCALGAALVACGWLITADAIAQSRASAESSAPAENPAPVEILRGSVAPPAPRVEPGAGPAEPVAIAGERLWIVDESTGRLTGCRLINTVQVGGQAIRCTERRLPQGHAARD